jgi:Na+-driven multidrug efflux pump
LYNSSWHFVEGCLSAQDTLVSRAAVSRDFKLMRHWSIMSLIVTSGLCLIFSLTFVFSPFIIRYVFLTKPHIADKAIAHIFLLLPAFWFHAFYRVVQKYLQSQLLMIPTLLCTVLGVVCNIIANYVLMYQLGIGFWGCGIGTSLSRLVMLVALYRYMMMTTEDAHL